MENAQCQSRDTFTVWDGEEWIKKPCPLWVISNGLDPMMGSGLETVLEDMAKAGLLVKLGHDCWKLN
jgi:hypothetical protein